MISAFAWLVFPVACINRKFAVLFNRHSWSYLWKCQIKISAHIKFTLSCRKLIWDNHVQGLALAPYHRNFATLWLNLHSLSCNQSLSGRQMEKSSVNSFWKGNVSLSGPVLEFFVVFLSNETEKIITSVSLFRKVHWIQETFKGWCSVSVQHICFGKVFMACDSRNPRLTYILVFVLVLMVTKCSVLFHIQPDWRKKQ